MLGSVVQRVLTTCWGRYMWFSRYTGVSPEGQGPGSIGWFTPFNDMLRSGALTTCSGRICVGLPSTWIRSVNESIGTSRLDLNGVSGGIQSCLMRRYVVKSLKRMGVTPVLGAVRRYEAAGTNGSFKISYSPFKPCVCCG